MSQVFISYAREDEKLAGRLARGLQDRGWLVWWDPMIRFGRPYRRTIKDALDEADCVIVLWSKESVDSDWVSAEASRARDRGVLLPVLLDKVEPPLPFGEDQALDFTRWDGSTTDRAFERLVREVGRQAGPPMPRLPPGAPPLDDEEPPPGAATGGRNKLVILFDHEDGDFLKKKGSTKVTDFVKFLQAIAPGLGLEVWWDEDRLHPGWDPVVEEIVDQAAVVLLVVSVDLLLSSYVTSPRAQRAYQRVRQHGVMIAVRYKIVPGHPYDWLKTMPAVPKAGMPIDQRKARGVVYKELTDLIEKEVRGRRLPIRDAKGTRTIRLLSPEQHSDAQLKILREDACNRAVIFVPDLRLRKRICSEARKLGAVDGGVPPLSKASLARLDDKFLAFKEKRKPDPKKIRWVLRCCDLHPQAKLPPGAPRI